jgi:hypothetical protein
MTVKISMLFLWVEGPCKIVGRYRRFEETLCLRLYPLNSTRGERQDNIVIFII